MMEKANLEKAISILYEMELNNYLMTRAIQRLNYQISQLGYEQKFYAPVRQEASMDPDSVFVPGCLGTILGAIAGGMTGCSSGFFDGIGGFVLGCIVGFAVGSFIGLIIADMSQSKRDAQLQKEYETELSKYNECVEIDDRRVKRELQEQKILIAERDALRTRLKEAKSILNEFYIRVGIDRDFRSLIPIGKMDDLIRLKIASALEGSNGLNALVRRELREDAFYIKLEELSSKLDTIIGQNNKMYNELMDINYKCDNMIKSAENSARLAVKNNQLLNEAVENSRISAYNSERIATENRYQSLLMTFDRR